MVGGGKDEAVSAAVVFVHLVSFKTGIDGGEASVSGDSDDSNVFLACLSLLNELNNCFVVLLLHHLNYLNLRLVVVAAMQPQVEFYYPKT